MRHLPVILVLLASPAHAVTPEGSPAVLEAIRTGEVFGAAAVCGVPDARLIDTARRIIHAIRLRAKTPEEVDRARVRHEQAVERGAAEIQAGRRTCPEALRAFEAMDAEMVRI